MQARRFPNPIFVALDTPELGQAQALAAAVGSHVGGFKVGLEFISAQGPRGIEAIAALGRPVFADVKFHDIPNTVAGAVREIAKLGVAIMNVHVSGGEAMLKAAVEAARGVDARMRIIGVTVLTSFSDADLAPVGQAGPLVSQVQRLAALAQSCGLDGVVCSAREAPAVRAAAGQDFLIVTPGIRPAGSDVADQRRVTTPAEALAAGADILVVGRPITAAPDPTAAAAAIAADIQAVRV